ncbi:PIG-L family deacetylase [Opitutaceae bacterium EW11]|nr:PIG-L family deacetylase [Opitutaceae bacterium EW11]
MPPRDPAECQNLLARLCGQTGDEGPEPRTLFVFAHPDDETVGASFLVSRLPDSLLVYVTDGAPRDGLDAKASGFATAGAYARARRRETAAALGHAGVPAGHIRFLDIVDQEAVHNLGPLTRELLALIRDFAPEAILTHPYEGGHPDHDATAFAVHAACALLEREGRAAPAIMEMTSYHNRNGAFAFGDFLDNSESEVIHVPLENGQRELKQRMIDSHPSQNRVLRSVAVAFERYRVAPAYDFSRPPHSGQPLYELLCWNMSGSRWRRLALAAGEELGLVDPYAALQSMNSDAGSRRER